MTDRRAAELRAYEPSANEKLAAVLMRLAGGDDKRSYEAAKKAADLLDVASLGNISAGHDLWSGVKKIAGAVGEYFNPSPFSPVDLETFKRDRRTKRESLEDAMIRADREARGSKEYQDLMAQGQRRAAETLVTRQKLSAETSWRKAQGTVPEEEAMLDRQYRDYVKGLDENRGRELNKGFAERNPGTAAALTIAGPLISGYLTKGLLNSRAGLGAQLVREAEAARKTGDPIEIYDTAAKVARWAGAKQSGKTAAGVAATATIPADLRLLTDVWDAKTLPHDAGAKERADKKLTWENRDNLLAEFLLGTASGGVGALVGAKFARPAPSIEARQLADVLRPDYSGKVSDTAGTMIRLGEARRRALQAKREADEALSPAPPAGAGGGTGPNSLPQPTPPPPGGAGVPPPSPSYASYDPATHGVVSRQYLDELLSHGHDVRRAFIGQEDTAQHMRSQLQSRYAAKNLPPVDPKVLTSRAQSSFDAAKEIDGILARTNSRITNPRLRQYVLDAIAGKDHTLALPLVAGGGAAAHSFARTPDADAELDRLLGTY